MTREEKQKAINVLKISAPVITVTQKEFEDYIQTLNKIIDWLEHEPCTDAISRQAAIDAFERFIHELGIKDEPYNYGEMALSPQNIPPVNPAEKVGKWIVHPKGIYAHLVCDKCLSNAPYDCRTNYCPNCGAKMDVPDNNVGEIGG